MTTTIETIETGDLYKLDQSNIDYDEEIELENDFYMEVLHMLCIT
ncbi:MAG: hypothetical protein OEZ01_01700 [Candidatus Heimdallarchaeota archaeon]|nr:hypothetical protein [Candidatus Heimdallarchaeota archaeon]MDH5644688.1 hypothetical protein [Candidatus Heimdallarchaeota archaeon]